MKVDYRSRKVVKRTIQLINGRPTYCSNPYDLKLESQEPDRGDNLQALTINVSNARFFAAASILRPLKWKLYYPLGRTKKKSPRKLKRRWVDTTSSVLPLCRRTKDEQEFFTTNNAAMGRTNEAGLLVSNLRRSS